MKELVITLLILVSSEKIEHRDIQIFEISCYDWYLNNIKMTESKKTLFGRRPYHLYEGQRVVGYICSDKEAR